MKPLRKISLNIDRETWGNEYGYGFYMKSRYICAYLEKAVSKAKLELIDSSKICIHGVIASPKPFYTNSSNIGVVEIPFNQSLYDSSKSEAERGSFFRDFLRQGLQALPEGSLCISNEIYSLAAEFVANNSEYKWQHKKKLIKAIGISVSLDCSMSQERFSLMLNTWNKKAHIKSMELFATDPDELAFHYKFKNIDIGEDSITITSKLSEPLAQISFDELKK